MQTVLDLDIELVPAKALSADEPVANPQTAGQVERVTTNTDTDHITCSSKLWRTA